MHPRRFLPALALATLLATAAQAQAPGAPGSALDADPGTGAVKVCSPVASPQWRSMIPVPQTWTFLDCMGFAGEMGANHFQLGCLFANVTPYAKKYAWGPLVRIEPAALAKPQPPVPSCGW